MIEARIVKVGMVASLAAFAFIVTFDNVTDYGSNFEFVRHVLSMDTTFPGDALLYRAIAMPPLWHLGYWIIILGEGLTCLAFAGASAALARNLRADAVRFNRSKRLVFVGAGLGFLVWFFGFMVVGGEWFAMWQSKIWNGQEAAFCSASWSSSTSATATLSHEPERRPATATKAMNAVTCSAYPC